FAQGGHQEPEVLAGFCTVLLDLGRKGRDDLLPNASGLGAAGRRAGIDPILDCGAVVLRRQEVENECRVCRGVAIVVADALLVAAPIESKSALKLYGLAVNFPLSLENGTRKS